MSVYLSVCVSPCFCLYPIGVSVCLFVAALPLRNKPSAYVSTESLQRWYATQNLASYGYVVLRSPEVTGDGEECFLFQSVPWRLITKMHKMHTESGQYLQRRKVNPLSVKISKMEEFHVFMHNIASSWIETMNTNAPFPGSNGVEQNMVTYCVICYWLMAVLWIVNNEVCYNFDAHSLVPVWWTTLLAH